MALVMSVATHPFFGELAGVEPDAHVAIDDAVERDLADPGHRLEALLHLVVRRVGEDLAREWARDAQREDRGVVGVDFRNRGGLHVLGRERWAWATRAWMS